MLTVARVDQAGHLVEPAAVAGEMPFDLGGGYPPLLPQQRAHIVKGIHGIGVMLLPAEHPHPADPAGLVGHIPVNAAQIGRRKPRELLDTPSTVPATSCMARAAIPSASRPNAAVRRRPAPPGHGRSGRRAVCPAPAAARHRGYSPPPPHKSPRPPPARDWR